jgi:hypothetical protein
MKSRVVATIAGIVALSAASVGFGGQARAAVKDWKLIPTVGPEKVFIDLNSVRSVADSPSQVIFWKKETGLSIKIQKKIVRSRINLTQVDCDQNLIALGPITAYDKAGKVVGSTTEWGDWETVLPETVGEDIRDLVCAYWDANPPG